MTDLEQQLTDHVRERAAAATPRCDLEAVERVWGPSVRPDDGHLATSARDAGLFRSPRKGWNAMRRCLVVLIAALVGSGVVFAQPAHAIVPSPYTLLDPVRTEHVYRNNDIRSVRIVHQSTVSLTVRTREGVNPATHPAWRHRWTGMALGLITTPGTDVDFYIRLLGRPAGPAPPELNADLPGHQVDCPSLTFELLDSNRYRFTLARSCINNPGGLRVRAWYLFDPPGPADDREDRAGPSPKVAFAA